MIHHFAPPLGLSSLTIISVRCGNSNQNGEWYWKPSSFEGVLRRQRRIWFAQVYVNFFGGRRLTWFGPVSSSQKSKHLIPDFSFFGIKSRKFLQNGKNHGWNGLKSVNFRASGYQISRFLWNWYPEDLRAAGTYQTYPMMITRLCKCETVFREAHWPMKA